MSLVEYAARWAGSGVRVERPVRGGLAHEVAWRGLGLLLDEWAGGFAEAAHWLQFPRSQGFLGPDDDYLGDLFARALIADTLRDWHERTDGQLAAILDSEIEYLLSQRRTSGAGGWSYFPKLRELPADADDLAQVMQVLLRNGRRDAVARFCDYPISVLLTDNARADGSFSTWIMPDEKDAELALQSHWVEIAWGSSADCEVIANLLYALILYDAARYARAIAKGAEFLVSRQEPDGSWRSTWYHGPYYGTWACVRVLAMVNTVAASEAVRAARAYLIREQQPDGGWGHDGRSDPLSTALAMLGLHHDSSHAAARGLSWLAEAQDPDGGWAAVPFIRMELGRPTGKPWATLSYGSRTISTAFAVKAALMSTASGVCQ